MLQNRWKMLDWAEATLERKGKITGDYGWLCKRLSYLFTILQPCSKQPLFIFLPTYLGMFKVSQQSSRMWASPHQWHVSNMQIFVQNYTNLTITDMDIECLYISTTLHTNMKLLIQLTTLYAFPWSHWNSDIEQRLTGSSSQRFYWSTGNLYLP